MDEIIGEFLVESYEGLDRLDQDLVALEEHPGSTEILGSIFRTMHTIKGTCGFLGFSRLESVAHAAENLLSLLRDGSMSMNQEIASALLATVDAVRQQLAGIEATGEDPDNPHEGLRTWLGRLQAGEFTSSAASAVAEPAAAVVETPSAEVVAETASAPVKKKSLRPRKKVGEILVEQDVVAPADVTLALAEQDLGDTRVLGTIIAAHGTASVDEVEDAIKTEHSAAAPEASGGEGSGGDSSKVADSTIRVDVNILDTLMNLVGELVLARNQILQLANGNTDFSASAQRLNLITSELQEGVMKTRMQPIGNVWSKFPRVVRNIAVSCGKQVRIRMEGAETELDKTIIEAIKDPLTHLVRNSVDHGIEGPEGRIAAGKPVEGTLVLRAYHESGKVNIEITDDGAGIDAAKIRAKAIERGLLTPEQSSRTSDRDVLGMIFAPGFSTAEKITNVSGRGVGMDVVKTNIERIGGTVELQTEIGRGTTFKVKIPLTLAIIPALVVSAGADRYAIPQISLLELVRLEGDQVAKGIEFIHGAPVYRLRGRLLPVVELSSVLGGRSIIEKRRSGTALTQGDAVNIVVLQADDRQFGLVVDAVNDTQEIVVKPLGKQIKDIEVFAGATIMGDGRVALILDVLGIAQRSGVISESRERALAEAEAELAASHGDGRQSLLVVAVGDQQQAAIPLSDVERLEEFPRTAIEQSRGREVVQYRGEILPLVDLPAALGTSSFGVHAYDEAEAGPLSVIVYSRNGRQVGIVVGQILDIVDEDLAPSGSTGDLITGTVVVSGKVTDIVDVATLVRSHVGSHAWSDEVREEAFA